MNIDFKKLTSKEVSGQCHSAWDNSNSHEELEVLLAEIALDSLDELKYQPLPSRPFKLVEFQKDKNSLKFKKRPNAEKAQILDIINKDTDVVKYYEKLWHAAAQNLSNVRALERYIDTWLTWDESDRGRQCWEIYNSYPRDIICGEVVLWKKRDFQGKSETTSTKPKTEDASYANHVW